MSWHETSWWWPTKSAESAVIRRLDDHLRRINFYEPVQHNWDPVLVQGRWSENIQTVFLNLQNTYTKACQFKAATYCDDSCNASHFVNWFPFRKAINLREPGALSLLYDDNKNDNCVHIVLYVLCGKKRYGRVGAHAILIVFDLNSHTWTPYDPNGRGFGLGFVDDDEIKNVVQARLDEHFLHQYNPYRLVPQEKGSGAQNRLELTWNNVIRKVGGSCTMVAMLAAMFMFHFNIFCEPHVTRLMNNAIKLLQRQRRSISGSWLSNAKPDEEAFFIVLYGTWKKLEPLFVQPSSDVPQPFPSHLQLTHPDDVNALCCSLGGGVCNRTVHSDRNTVWCYCEAHMKELLGPLILKDITFDDDDRPPTRRRLVH
jgi:hypothetical protein